jgi:hypothetical protein
VLIAKRRVDIRKSTAFPWQRSVNVVKEIVAFYCIIRNLNIHFGKGGEEI